MEASACQGSSQAAGETGAKQPVVILVVGMAGTGKTTLVHRLQHYAAEKCIPSYYINLDPAVMHVPYNANIDVRDTVNYKEVMKGYQLGPNGAILTSLNLFATKFNQVVSLLEQKEGLEWIIVDTPGQIEVFTWSASGQLIAESLAAVFPTIVLFVADTTRCANAQSFVSTMLYASGIMLKQQIPLLVVFNKTDVVSADMAISWMQDPDALQDAVDAEPSSSGAAVSHTLNASGGYASTLARSMSLFLHEFYEDLPYATISAATGTGMEALEAAIGVAKRQALEEKSKHANERHEERAARQAAALCRDVNEENK